MSHFLDRLTYFSQPRVSFSDGHGVTTSEDQLVDAATESLSVGESYQGGRHRFDGSVTLARSGAFGYTVRVVPRHASLVSPAELGVVALPG